MTTPKVSTIKRSGSRFYVEPETGEKVPGVTSVLNMLPKPFLQYWAAKLVAEEAVEDLGSLVSLVLRDPAAAVDHLKNTPRRFVRKSADIGTDAHDIFERLSKGENLGRVHPDLKPYAEHFADFLDTVQPEYHFMEETVWSDSYAYAGSFDAFATIEGEKVWLDNKTTRSGVHEETGLQLAAYRFADHILRADGSRTPMPKADGGAVVHVRPEGWKLVPVRADEDAFEVFKHLRQVFEYDSGMKRSMVGLPIASGPASAASSGPKRTRAKGGVK